VPASFSAPNTLSAQFLQFNFASGRGVFNAWSGVQVSANSGATPVEFADIDPSYSSTFGVFRRKSSSRV
jgi:hypothetical protein